VRLFLDSSVLLAAAGSSKGASRLLFDHATSRGWQLLTADYCLREAEFNLPKLGKRAELSWAQIIRPALNTVTAQLTLDRPLIYRATKDRPVVISALSQKADYLLTLDRDDFHDLLGRSVYGLPIRTPGEFLREIR
jgi:predicted nucleic acid-binding protein